MDCNHARSREIAEVQRNVEDGQFIELRVWFCFDCGHKWETREKLGDVESIELRINLT
jgi:hypothetical protein